MITVKKFGADFSMKQPSQRHIFLFGFLTLFYWFSLNIFNPYFIKYLAQLGADDFMIGLIGGSYGLSMTLLLIPVGILSDKMNSRKLFIILGSVATLVSLAGMCITTSVWLMLVLRFIMGASLSCWVCYSVLFGSYFPAKDSVKAQGILNAWNWIGQTLSFLIAAWSGTIFGMKSTFYIGFIAALITVITSFFIKETPIPKTDNRYSVTQMLSVAKDWWIIKVSIMGLIFQTVLFAAFIGFTQKIAVNLGANAFELSMISLVFVVTSIPTSILCGRYGIKFGERKCILVTSFLFALCCILQPFCASFIALIILQGIAGLVRGIYYPMLVGMSIKKTPYAKQAAAMGVFQAVYSIGVTIGPIITGALSQMFSLTVAFCVVGAIGMITPIISFFGLKKEEQLS